METTARVKKRNRRQTTLDLLNAAAELLSHDGSSTPAIATVAKHAGCDKVLIYRYFGDIDGLLKALAEYSPLYPSPWHVQSNSNHHDPRSSFVLQSKVYLASKLEEMPLARSLITHRWYKRNNPLGKALRQARAQWLQATSQQFSERLVDPAIVPILQLLAEENDPAASSWLEAQPHRTDTLESKKATPQSAFKEDALPDNLL